MCRNVGKIGPQDHAHATKLPTARSAYTALRQFQHLAPPTQHTFERGRCRGDLQIQFHSGEAALRDRLIVALFKATYVYFLALYEISINKR